MKWFDVSNGIVQSVSGCDYQFAAIYRTSVDMK